MALPNPANPREWQTAYSRGQAHIDSERRAVSLDLAFLAILPIVGYLTYLLFRNEGLLRRIDTMREWAFVIVGFILVIFIIFYVESFAALRASGNFLQEFYQPPE